jgi:lysophospholipase L1-like esterase
MGGQGLCGNGRLARSAKRSEAHACRVLSPDQTRGSIFAMRFGVMICAVLLFCGLHPKVVVILAGTNDIAGNTGPMRLEDIEANYASMAQLASANSIRVVFSSVLPVHNYTPQSQNMYAGRSPAKIHELNRWLKTYVAEHSGCIYLDYFSSMVDDKGLLKRDLAEDGLHPNPAGYKIMAPLAETAVAQALAPLKP